MATPQNTNLTRTTGAPSTSSSAGADTSKKNFTAIKYGNDHGHVAFGQISKDGAVQADVMLQGSDGRHHIVLEKDGPRKGFTTAVAPQTFQVSCGHDLKKDKNALFLEAVNGDIIIKATNGRVRIEGLNVDIIAKGPDTTEGNVRIQSNEGIELSSKNIVIDGSSSYKLATTGQAEMVANSTMRIYSSLIQGVTDAVANKDSKNGGGLAFQLLQLLGV